MDRIGIVSVLMDLKPALSVPGKPFGFGFILMGDTSRCMRGLCDDVKTVEMMVTDSGILSRLFDTISEEEYRELHIVDGCSGDIKPIQYGAVGLYNCQRFDVPSDPDLPWPYDSYSHFKTGNESIGTYKRTVKKWISDNTVSIDDVNSFIDMAVGMICDKADKEALRDQLTNFPFRYIPDFSGLSFGIVLDQKEECIYINHLCDEWRGNEHFKESEWNKLNLKEKFEWMNQHCEFIPIRISREDFYDYKSHKWSHIKTDAMVVNRLHNFLHNGNSRPPRDDVYYYIRMNIDTGCLYLARDLKKSPRKEFSKK